MRLEQEWKTGNSVEAAYGAHLDRWVREEGCRKSGAKDFTVTIEDDGDATKVVLDRQMPLRGMPGPAKKVLGETARIVQTERWHAPDADGVSRADVVVEFPGKPVAMTAEAVISPTDSGSHEVLTGEVKVKVPVVGKVVEPEIVKQISRSLDVEMQVGIDWLAEGNGG